MTAYKFRRLIAGFKSRRFYSTCLILTTAVLSFMLYGGSTVSTSLDKGMKNMDRRLGADIMLVPRGSKEQAENLLLEGQRGFFYFDASIADKVSNIDGVKEVTAQCFLKSLSADCCSSEVELVFYDPDTDFVVGPWIEENYKSTLQKDAVIVGSDINVENGKIKLFGREYDVVSKMSRTGTALDVSVYFSMESMPSVLHDAEEKATFLTDEQKRGDIISSVYINIDEGYKIEDIVANCHREVGDVFDGVYPKMLDESLSEDLLKVTDLLGGVIFTSGILIIGVLIILNSIIINSRKQEVALLRILGHSGIQMAKMLIWDEGLTSGFGALGGALLGGGTPQEKDSKNCSRHRKQKDDGKYGFCFFGQIDPLLSLFWPFGHRKSHKEKERAGMAKPRRAIL